MSKEPNKKSAIDQVIMGAIIGTAIGSAVGMGLAPKKGSETRQIAKEKSRSFFDLAKGFLKDTFKKISKEESKAHMKEIPNEMEIFPPKSIDHE